MGDQVEYTIPEPKETEILPTQMQLDIVYEDEDVVVINKPKGLVVHPAAGHQDDTLVNGLLYALGDDLSGINGELRPGIVHRIDKDTSGLLVVAKNDFAHRSLATQLETHDVWREYTALVQGGFHADEGTVNLPIGRHPTDRKKMAIIRDGIHTARPAVTHYRVVERFGAITHLSLRLETGRTHQIRVHMSHLGHPLLGDTVYGGGGTPFEKRHAALLSGQALHAGKLGFTHPRTEKEMLFEAPMPAEMQELLRILRSSAL
jgi:23S rRNA pseudouridine1911/1915/1917 synthase